MRKELKKSKTIVSAFGNNTVQPVGEITLPYSRELNQEIDLDFVVIDTLDPLLGLQGCIRMNLVKKAQAVDKRIKYRRY